MELKNDPFANGITPAAPEDITMTSDHIDNNNNNIPKPTNDAHARHRTIISHAISLKETIANSSAMIAREAEMVVDMLEIHLRELHQNPPTDPNNEENNFEHQVAVYNMATEYRQIRNDYAFKAMKELQESWKMEDDMKKSGKVFGVKIEEDDEEGDDNGEYGDGYDDGGDYGNDEQEKEGEMAGVGGEEQGAMEVDNNGIPARIINEKENTGAINAIEKNETLNVAVRARET